MRNYIEKIRKYIALETATLNRIDVEQINAVINILENNRLNGGKVYICGNGGSATTASHYVCDFNKGISLDQTQKYHFICLNDNIATMMALANDLGYEWCFQKQIENRITDKDILFCISGSGNSRNVVNAIEYAKSQKSTVIGLTGYDGGKVKELSDYNIHIPIDNMQITEDLHMVIDHLIMWILSAGANV